jgi:hypothetical protein
MTPVYDSDADAAEARATGRLKPRPKGKIPYAPDREAPLPRLRDWLSLAAGLPREVGIESVVRSGREDDDSLMIVLSNGLKMRCAHQRILQQPRTLQAFLASHSDGIAQPLYLAPAEAGDFYATLCRYGSAVDAVDASADLHERLTMFVGLTSEVIGSLADPGHRYITIQAIRKRSMFDRGVALAMTNGHPESPPVLLRDSVDDARYIRASEWYVYLRCVVQWTVNESNLASRMAELGSIKINPQAWNVDRSHKTHLVFFRLPDDL